MKTKVLIVDDEPLARARIRDLLKLYNNFEVIGESCNGLDAIKHIQEKTPDLVFLDVQMPELNGFEVLESIGVNHIPQVIFVTAYDQYALRAFEVHAIDYLLKPFDRQRFTQAINRAKEIIDLKKNGAVNYHSLEKLLQGVKSTPKYLNRFIVKSGGRIYFLKADEIRWVEATGNYVTLYVEKDKHLLRETMHNMEKKLDPHKFMRIHRSAIVNIDYIKEIKAWFNNEYLIFLQDGTQLTMSRRYRENFKNYS